MALASKSMLRAYVRVALALSAAFSLLLLAVGCYLAFYSAFIPDDSVSMALYFDYSSSAEVVTPSAFTQLTSDTPLLANLPYMICIKLTIPRTPHNRALGNFMLNLRIYNTDPLSAIAQSTDIPVDRLESQISRHDSALLRRPFGVVAEIIRSVTLLDVARPAILPYRSLLLETIDTFLRLPLLLFGFSQQADELSIPLVDEWTASTAPAFVAAQIDRDVQVYKASVVWLVKWTGLRYFMRHHHFLSFVIGVSAFWLTEIVACFLAWALFSVVFGHSSAAFGSDRSRDPAQRKARQQEISRMLEQISNRRIKQEIKSETEESQSSSSHSSEAIESIDQSVQSSTADNSITDSSLAEVSDLLDDELEEDLGDTTVHAVTPDPIDTSAIVSRDQDLAPKPEKGEPAVFHAEDLIPQSPSSTLAALSLEDDLAQSKEVLSSRSRQGTPSNIKKENQ